MTQHHIHLAFDDFPALPEAERERLLAPLAAHPPEGLTYTADYGMPVLSGVREADSKFAAIASVATEVKARYGLAFNDAGIEKPDEWVGDEHGQQVTAHLVLAAVHRAKHCGVPPEELVELMRAMQEQGETE